MHLCVLLPQFWLSAKPVHPPGMVAIELHVALPCAEALILHIHYCAQLFQQQLSDLQKMFQRLIDPEPLLLASYTILRNLGLVVVHQKNCSCGGVDLAGPRTSQKNYRRYLVLLGFEMTDAWLAPQDSWILVAAFWILVAECLDLKALMDSQIVPQQH